MEHTVVAPRWASRVGIEGAETNTRIEGPFVALTLQLGMVLGLAWTYRLELERGFGVVAILTLAGFVVHSWLPIRIRLPFFLLLTATAVGILLGAEGALWLAGG